MSSVVVVQRVINPPSVEYGSQAPALDTKRRSARTSTNVAGCKVGPVGGAKRNWRQAGPALPLRMTASKPTSPSEMSVRYSLRPGRLVCAATLATTFCLGRI